MCQAYEFGEEWRQHNNSPFRSSHTAALETIFPDWRANPCFLDGFYGLPDEAHSIMPEWSEENALTGITMGKISSVRLPWTADQWLDALDNDGQTLPMCCGNISDVRSMLLGALPEGRRLEAKEFQAAVSLLSEHDGFEKYAAGQLDGEPLADIFRIWSRIQGRCDLRRQDVLKELDPNNPEHALRIVVSCSIGAYFSRLSGSGELDRDRFDQRRDLLLELHRMAPALKTLYERLRDLDPCPVSGFAIIDERTGKVMETRRGLAFYFDEMTARGTIRIWEAATPEKGEEPPKPKIVKARASVADGIVLLDTPEKVVGQGCTSCSFEYPCFRGEGPCLKEPLERRYETDDRDGDHMGRTPELVMLLGGNGDYYIGSAEKGTHPVGQLARICTSGGAASRNPLLLRAVAALYRAMGPEMDRRKRAVFMMERDPIIIPVDRLTFGEGWMVIFPGRQVEHSEQPRRAAMLFMEDWTPVEDFDICCGTIKPTFGLVLRTITDRDKKMLETLIASEPDLL